MPPLWFVVPPVVCRATLWLTCAAGVALLLHYFRLSERIMEINDVPLEITCLAVKSKLDADEVFLFIDCRQPDEHATARIEGARLIPMGELASRLGEFAAYQDQEIVIHCHHGGRSERVARWLREQGFGKARTMVGGIDRWAEEIDRSVPRY